MTNLATAMTNYILAASNHVVSGQLGITETYVHILWPWITLPAILTVLNTYFLLTGIIETKSRGADVWKDSELALLFYGLSEGNERFFRLRDVSEMNYVASRMNVTTTSTRVGGQVLRLTDQQVRIPWMKEIRGTVAFGKPE